MRFAKVSFFVANVRLFPLYRPTSARNIRQFSGTAGGRKCPRISPMSQTNCVQSRPRHTHGNLDDLIITPQSREGSGLETAKVKRSAEGALFASCR